MGGPPPPLLEKKIFKKGFYKGPRPVPKNPPDGRFFLFPLKREKKNFFGPKLWRYFVSPFPKKQGLGPEKPPWHLKFPQAPGAGG